VHAQIAPREADVRALRRAVAAEAIVAHGRAGPDTPPRAAVAAAASAPPSSVCTKERKDTGATNSVPTQSKESRSMAKMRRRLSALDCTVLPLLPPPPPP